MRHFLKDSDFSIAELADLFSLSADLKKNRKAHPANPLHRQSWGLLFFKKSTRTRVSFQVGISELHGTSLTLNENELQLTRGESIADTAKVLSRYLHGLVIRCHEHAIIEEFAKHASIPVINALTDFLHPCQVYSDIFTLAEKWSHGKPSLDSLKGKKVAFLGDTACNMANSWVLVAAMTGMSISLGGPKGFEPGKKVCDQLKADKLPQNFHFTNDPIEAVKDADMVYTDVWVSMGDEAEEAIRISKMKPYAITKELMRHAKPTAYFMHCLPAHPGLEVSQEVLDSPQSIIFDQAENRLHMQKAILAKIAESVS